MTFSNPDHSLVCKNAYSRVLAARAYLRNVLQYLYLWVNSTVTFPFVRSSQLHRRDSYEVGYNNQYLVLIRR